MKFRPKINQLCFSNFNLKINECQNWSDQWSRYGIICRTMKIMKWVSSKIRQIRVCVSPRIDNGSENERNPLNVQRASVPFSRKATRINFNQLMSRQRAREMKRGRVREYATGTAIKFGLTFAKSVPRSSRRNRKRHI